jgi:CRP/FNR family transcriptional regulator
MPTSDTDKDLFHLLAAVPYMTADDDALIQAIVAQAVQQRYEAGQVVFLEGERNDALYVVQQGWLKAVKISADGRELVLHFIGPGEAFNTISVFVEGTNPATVIALETATVWMIPRTAILQLLDEHPKMAWRIIQHLAEHIQRLVMTVEDLSLRSIEARLARYLLEQSADTMMERPRWATQAELANRLGTVPDVLHRALQNLVKAELIRVERHQIEILNRSELEARAGLDK